MKPNSLTMLYRNLTNKERAAIAFEFAMTSRERELSEVVGSVPTKKYVCSEAEYQRWFMGFADMAALWGMIYWQTHTRKLAALCFLRLSDPETEMQQIRATLKAHIETESQLLALDQALEQVCELHGIDAISVRRLSGAEPFVPTIPLEPDTCYQHEVKKTLLRLLEPN